MVGPRQGQRFTLKRRYHEPAGAYDEWFNSPLAHKSEHDGPLAAQGIGFFSARWLVVPRGITG